MRYRAACYEPFPAEAFDLGRCPVCGKVVEAQDAFCPSCGAPQHKEQDGSSH